MGLRCKLCSVKGTEAWRHIIYSLLRGRGINIEADASNLQYSIKTLYVFPWFPLLHHYSNHCFITIIVMVKENEKKNKKNFNVFVSSKRKSVTYDNHCTECGTLLVKNIINHWLCGWRERLENKILCSYVHVVLSLKGKW